MSEKEPGVPLEDFLKSRAGVSQQPGLVQRAVSAVARPLTSAFGGLVQGLANVGGMETSAGFQRPPEISGVSPEARGIAEFVVPQTTTQAGITAGTLAGGPFGVAPRIAGATLGGAFGGAFGEEGPLAGGIEGFVGGAAGELFGAAWGKIARSRPGGRQAVNFKDVDAIASEIGDLVPPLKNLRTPQDLKRASVSVQHRRELGDRYDGALTEVDRLIGRNKIVAPSLGVTHGVPTGVMGPSGAPVTQQAPKPLTIAEAVRAASEIGFSGFGGAKDTPILRTMAAKQRRETYAAALGEIKTELMRLNPTGEAVTAFEAARKEYAVGITFLNILRDTPGVFRRLPGGQEVNVNALRQGFERKFSKLEVTLLPDELERITRVLYRGAPLGAGDIMASSTGNMSSAANQLLRSGGGTGTLGVLAPRTLLPNVGSEYAGRAPFSLGPATQTGLDLGIERLVNPLLQGLGAEGLPLR